MNGERDEQGLVIAAPRHDGDIDAFAAVDAESFGETPAESLAWMRTARQRFTFRLARRGDEVVGGYALMPAGQYFGARALRAACVTAVAVTPAWRRQGVAGLLLRDLVDVARGEGYAVAPLMAATTRLYRRWGWEVCARHATHRVKTSALAGLRGEGRAIRDPESAAVEALRRAFLCHWDGPLERPEWWMDTSWEEEARRALIMRYGWVEGGRLTGAMRYRMHHQGEDSRMDVTVEDFLATTAASLRGLLGLLGGTDAQSDEICFVHSCLPMQPELLHLLPDADRVVATSGGECWMQRIVDLPAAVAQRGWASGVRERVELEVADPVADVARRVLEVADGEGRAETGGDGRVRCGIGALSAWLSGALPAVEWPRLGLGEGPVGDLEALDRCLGVRNPWMCDYF